MGGSTMKTAKVWKYFIQLPSNEQAAECRICCKKIKATNSSTTGMIRHLRSCHSTEYQVLQAARQNSAGTNQGNSALNTKHLSNPGEKFVQKDTKSYSIASIIASTLEHRPSGNSSFHHIFVDTNSTPLQKRAKFDECCNAMDLRMERKNRVGRNEQAEKIRKVKENSWPDDHPDALQITNQNPDYSKHDLLDIQKIGLMLLLDNESPEILNRAGFRNLLQLLQPKYQLPSTDQFHKSILPRLCDQLRVDSSILQQNSNLNNQQNELEGLSVRFDSSTTALMPKKYNIAYSVPGENISEPAPNTTNNEQVDLDRVVINSIRSAQNISQSFSHSIQLCDEDFYSDIDYEATLPACIGSFIKRIGEYVFPQAELTDLLTRCYHACRYLKGSAEDGQQWFELGIQSSSRSLDLADCVEYVHKNLKRIHSLHALCPIPMFKPFTDDETQFLSDLNMHMHTL